MIPVKSGPRAAPSMRKGNVRDDLYEMVRRLFFLQKRVYKRINPLHHIISGHILHSGLYTISDVLARRICFTIKRFFG